MTRTRLRSLRKKLADEKIAALLVITHEHDNKNVSYISGFRGSDAVLLITPKHTLAYTDARYTERFKKEAPDFTLVNIQPRVDTTNVITHLIEKANIPSGARIGCEGNRTSVNDFNTWKSALPYELVPLSRTIEHLRQYKDTEEIKFIARACKISSRAFDDFIKFVKPGARECDIVREIDRALLAHGAVRPSFSTIVASGPNAAIPHHEPGTRKLRAGETVVIDYGGEIVEGYSADITRTVFVPGAKPDPELLKIYDIVLQAQKRATRVLKPGTTWKEYDTVAREYIASQGYGEYFTHSLTHSLGLDTHDPFNYKDPLAEGVVLTNEPGIYLPGKGGVRIEDDFVITKTGAKKLTSVSYNPHI